MWWVGQVASEKTLQGRLGQGASKAFLINSIGIGLAFLAQLVLARTLGTEGYGSYAYVLAWINVLALVAALGFPTALLRFVASYRACEEWGLLRGIVQYAERRVLLAGTVITCLGVGLLRLFGDDLEVALRLTFYAGLPIVPVLALLRTRAAIVRGLGQIVTALAPELIARETTILVLVFLLGMLAAGPLPPWAAMLVALAAAVVSVGLISWSMHCARPRAVVTASLVRRKREWLLTSLPLLALAGLGMLRSQLGVLILGWLTDTTMAGIYAVAARMALLVAFPLSTVNVVLGPTISALHARGDRQGLQSAVTMAALWTILLGVPIAVPLLAIPEFWLGWFGEGFTAGASALRLLLLGQLANAATGSVGLLMTMTGQERQAALLNLAALLGFAILAVLLMPSLGTAGVAFAEALTLALLNLTAAVLVWRRLRIIPGPLVTFRSRR